MKAFPPQARLEICLRECLWPCSAAQKRKGGPRCTRGDCLQLRRPCVPLNPAAVFLFDTDIRRVGPFNCTSFAADYGPST